MNEIVSICLHSLWIGALIALLLRFALALIPDTRSMLRGTMAMVALGSILPVTILFVKSEASIHFPSLPFPFHVTPFWIHLAAILWMTGFSLNLLGLGRDWIRVRQLCKSSRPVSDPEYISCFTTAKSDTGASSRLRLHCSEYLDGPVLIGILFPMIIIPASWLNGVPLDHLRSIFAHEIAHARRNDYFVNLMLRILEAFLFFNPAARWIGNIVRMEREHACDDFASRTLSSPYQYARTLLWFECLRSNSSANSLAAAFGGKDKDVPSRVQRLLRNSSSNERSAGHPRTGNFVLCLLSLLSIVALVGGSSLVAKTRPFPELQPGPIITTEYEAPNSDPVNLEDILKSTTPWNPRPDPLFTSVPLLKKGSRVIDLRKSEPQLFPELPNHYLTEQNLPFLDTLLPHRDLDGDGFSVIEEFQAGTDPKDAEAHPAFVNKLKFIKRHQQLYVIKFAARPDAKRFQLQRIPSAKWPQRETFFVKVGDTTADGQIRIDGFEEKQAKNRDGIITDASILKITHLPNGENFELVRQIEETIPTYYAQLEPLEGKAAKFFVAEGDQFSVPGDKEKWTLQSVEENQCVITTRTSSGEVRKVLEKQ